LPGLLGRFDHVGRFILNAIHSMVRFGGTDTPRMTMLFLPFNIAMLAAQLRDTGYVQVSYRRNRF